MAPEQPAAHETPAPRPAQASQEALAYEPVEEDDWLDEDDELPPPRPRRRLLGAGSNPIQAALLAVLLIACGFIGGVLVEKGQTSSGSGAGTSALASRFAGLRGGSATGATGATGASARSGAATGGGGSFFGAASGRTAGDVAYLAGSTLYVTNSEGNTIKVKTSSGTTVTKSVSSSVKAIHPGETVTVTGANTSGTVTAESISVGSAGGALAGLFGGSGGSSTTSGTGSSSSSPSLFGNGG